MCIKYSDMVRLLMSSQSSNDAYFRFSTCYTIKLYKYEARGKRPCGEEGSDDTTFTLTKTSFKLHFSSGVVALTVLELAL